MEQVTFESVTQQIAGIFVRLFSPETVNPEIEKTVATAAGNAAKSIKLGLQKFSNFCA